MNVSTAKPKPRYRRILLKLSGEALGGEKGFGISPESIHNMAEQIREVRDLGVEVVIVIGGGNIFRGSAGTQGAQGGIERATGEYMGKLATGLKGPGFQGALGKAGGGPPVPNAPPQ